MICLMCLVPFYGCAGAVWERDTMREREEKGDTGEKGRGKGNGKRSLHYVFVCNLLKMYLLRAFSLISLNPVNMSMQFIPVYVSSFHWCISFQSIYQYAICLISVNPVYVWIRNIVPVYKSIQSFIDICLLDNCHSVLYVNICFDC